MLWKELEPHYEPLRDPRFRLDVFIYSHPKINCHEIADRYSSKRIYANDFIRELRISIQLFFQYWMENSSTNNNLNLNLDFGT